MSLASMADFLINVGKVAIGIGLLIFIHELGHFLVAKLMGVRVVKFSIGFGKTLLGFKRGETEYVISTFPLGGYVKMVGEVPGEQDTKDPRALSNQAPWRRALIFVAGVTMNVIGTFVLFIVAFQVGVEFVVAEVGALEPGPAYEAGIREGDTIIEVNGRRMLDFSDVQATVALSDPSQDLSVVVDRAGERKTFIFKPRSDNRLPGGFPTIGVRAPLSTYVMGVEAGGVAEAAGIKPGDVIVSVQSDTAPRQKLTTYKELHQVLQSAREARVTLEIRSPDGTTRRQQVQARSTAQAYRLPWQLGPVTLNAVLKDGPADGAGLRRGDQVLSVAGKPVVSRQGLIDIIGEHSNRPMSITVRRGEQDLSLEVTPRTDVEPGGPKIGVFLGASAGAPPEVRHIEPDTSLAEADITAGSLVVRVGKKPCETIGDVQEALAPLLERRRLDETVVVPLTLRTPDGRDLVKEVPLTAFGEEYSLGIYPKPKVHLAKYGVAQSCVVGFRKTVTWLRHTVLTVRRIVFTRSVKPDAVAGPVQIPVIAYQHAKAGWGDFMYFLAILGANLAVINLLPIPILDGGQLVMLAIEKVKGSPLSEKAQAIAQYVGLFMILLLFAYIVRQDILKLIR